MIYQKKENLGASQSNWIMTLREKAIQLDSCCFNYTFEIESQNSMNTLVFSPDNITGSYHYDRFDIRDGLTQSFTASVMLNFEPGEYHYKVHQTEEKYDLDLNNSLGVVETGLLIVLSNEIDFITSTFSGTPWITYND